MRPVQLGLGYSLGSGTKSSNPLSSTAESMANLTSSIDILFLDSPLMEAEMREARSRVVPLPDKP
jgi:hypothetical protein